jgi:hypothetical protein
MNQRSLSISNVVGHAGLPVALDPLTVSRSAFLGSVAKIAASVSQSTHYVVIANLQIVSEQH